MIHLYDVSGLLYIGHNVNRPGDDFVSENLKGLPVKGLRYAIEKLVTNTGSSNSVFAIMDSHTNKSELFPDYKAQRSFNQEIFVQRELLKYLLPMMGIPMICQDNFEADDLFYCYMTDLYVNKKIPSSGVVIHSDDRDILGCVLDTRVSRVGLTSKTPTVYPSNYSNVLSNKGFVAYNSILPYTLFYGKPSNNLGVMKSASPDKLYADFLEYTRGFSPETLSFEIIFKKWLNDVKSSHRFSDSVIEEIENRMPVVFPRLTWDKSKAINYGEYNEKVVVDILSLLDEGLALKHINPDLRARPIDKIDKSILDKWISIYRSGVTSVDNYVPTDSTFFFSEREDSSFSNIGGF